jgi:hypothetical protein
MISPSLIRAVVITVFVGGIVGMIVASIADNNGAAITFGLITAVAALGLMLTTALSTTAAESGEEIDERVDRLVAAGADEDEVRDLVRSVRSMGRST